MLIDHIERVRSQPIEARRRYALVVSLILTGIIVAIWLSVLFAGRTQSGMDTAVEVKQDVAPGVTTLEETSTQFDASNTFLNDMEGGASRAPTPEYETLSVPASMLDGFEDVGTSTDFSTTTTTTETEPVEDTMESLVPQPSSRTE